VNISLIIPLVAFFSCLALLGMVLYRRYMSSSHRLFALFLFGMALWSICAFAARSSFTPEQAFVWFKAIPAAVILASTTFLHFSFVHTRIKPVKWLIPAAYLNLFIVMALSPTNLLIENVGVDAYGYYPIIGPLNILVSLPSYAFFIVGLTNFVKRYKVSTSYEERNSCLYIIIGVCCFMLGGVTDLLSIVLSLPVPPLGLLGNIFFTFLTSISLLKYHLLDLRLVLRKGAAYLLTSAIIALPYVGVIILIGRVLTDRALSTWVYFFVLLILALVLQPLWQWAQQMIDRLFYRERYDHLKALDHFSHEAQRITDLEQLGSTLVKLISESLQSDNAYLLVPSPSGDDFVTTATYQVKPSAPPPSVSLPNRSSLIQWLRRNEGIVSSQDLDINAQLLTLPAADRQNLQAIGAQLYIPIKTRDKELVGVLILGVKRSQQFYSIEDKQILAPIVSQVAMSLDNARLFQEAKDAYEQWKATQEYLVRSEKLRALGEMSSGIAHDFNNMLTGILGRAQLALDQVKDPKVERHLKLIEQATLDAAQIVRRLQDFARVRTDHATTLVQLNQIATDALEMVKPRLSERGEMQDVAIETSLYLDKIGPVRGDSTELREALVNILINAVEAMPHGGKLTVSTRQDNNSAVISISDTGIGMTSEVMKRMFEPFFTTKEQQGLGMGLSLVYGIVKRHGGDITVSSEPQKGSTFSVILPIATESAEVVTPPVPQSSTGHSDILVIDDNEEARNVLSEVLTMSGHSVDTAASGEEGLSLFEQNNYDLVVTDLGMPGISGRDVARAIKRDSPQTLVIMITGWGVQIDMAEEIVDGVIAKPFQKDAILRQIAQLVNARGSKVKEPRRSSRLE